jgi:hypothetical protein
MAESVVTSKAENQSHHSRRESCCGLVPSGCTRKFPEPSRGEGFGLLVETPKIDFMSRTGQPCSKYFRRALRIEATAKTYRLARFKNLTSRTGLAKSEAMRQEGARLIG